MPGKVHVIPILGRSDGSVESNDHNGVVDFPKSLSCLGDFSKATVSLSPFHGKRINGEMLT